MELKIRLWVVNIEDELTSKIELSVNIFFPNDVVSLVCPNYSGNLLLG